MRSIPDLICLSVLTLFLPMSIKALPGIWSHRNTFWDKGRWRATPFNRGWVRAMPTGVVGALFLVLGGWGAVFNAPVLAVLVSWTACLLCAVLVFVIVIFNQPKLFVPPYLRNEPGMFPG
ncbi:MAG: hypothetical protein WBF51_05005 [Candidatus Dormiibacterota bacterium]